MTRKLHAEVGKEVLLKGRCTISRLRASMQRVIHSIATSNLKSHILSDFNRSIRSDPDLRNPKSDRIGKFMRSNRIDRKSQGPDRIESGLPIWPKMQIESERGDSIRSRSFQIESLASLTANPGPNRSSSCCFHRRRT